jgi:hypothetical protein
MTYIKQKVKAKMLEYGLSKVHKVIIKKYTKDDEFMAAARKTRGEKFDYDMELND